MIRLRKSLSQHLLTDPNIIGKLIRTADVQPGETILEIGPGTGNITYKLLAAGAHVIAVEKDDRMARQLSHPHLQVHHRDILDFPIPACKVVANLPYQITTPIITRLLSHSTRIVVIIQDEVARRYTAPPNTSNYSSISLYLQAHADLNYCFKVSRKCFFPPPRVDSAVIDIRPKPCHLPIEFFDMVRTAFGQRRKMLRSTLKHLPIQEALRELNLPESTRPQELSLEKFVALYETLELLQSRKQ